MARCAVVSFRLGGADGVSVTAAVWARALRELGYDIQTIAGDGHPDLLVPWLRAGHTAEPEPDALRAILHGVDLVVVENLLTLPLNLPASMALVDVLRGRRALLHHHDPPWQRAEYASCSTLPADDSAWRHVTISHHTQAEFWARGRAAVTIYNGFDPPAGPGDRAGMRARLGVGPHERLLLHPVRAIARKNIPSALRLAEAVGATYWLSGATEDGYGAVLEQVLADARVPVLRTPFAPDEIDDAFAAADAVLFPSTWEGFGNPPIEAALRRRPVVVGDYPVARELRALGFHWLAPEAGALRQALAAPDDVALDHDAALAQQHFSFERTLDELGWVLAHWDDPWLGGCAATRR